MIVNDQITDATEDCCFIEGLNTEGMDRAQEIVVFQNEECCTTLLRGKHPAPNPLHVKDDTVITDLSQYLSRPFGIASATYTATTPGLLYNVSLSYSTYFSQLPNWSKLNNVFGFRATVVFKLQLLTTPQHSGILRLVFEPFGATRVSTTGLTSISYLPHAQINLADSTEVTLKIPFVQRLNYFYNKTANTYGQFQLITLTPAGVATGVLPAAYRLWTWVEDLELIGAAPSSTIVNQAGKTVSTVSKLTPLVKKKPSAAAKEVPPANLSSILSAGSYALNYLGKAIPSLSGFLGTPSWALGQAAGWAASFGWAKPRSTATNMKIFRTRNTYQHNVDGVDNSYNLSLQAENQIAPAALAETMIDEMALAYTTSRWGIINNVTLGSQATDTFIYRMKVSPKYLYWQATDNLIVQPLTGIIQPTSLLYLADEFSLWRGNIKVRLTIGSTKFHAARLVIGFIPTQNNSIAVGDTYNTDYLQTIWDIKSQTSIEFEIPYISPSNYLDMSTYTGTFFIKVLDTLVYPLNVYPSVNILVEVAGGEDFEVAVPRTPTFYNQSGNNVVTSTDMRSPAELCIGEKINSVKQIISRARFLGTQAMNSSLSWPNPVVTTTTTGSFFHKWKACYGLWRGSFNYHFLSNSPTSFCTAVLSNPVGAYSNRGADVMVSEERECHISLPYYSSNPNVSRNSADTIVPTVLFYTKDLNPEATNSYAVFGRAGDDVQFYYYLGPPPVTIRPATVDTLNTLFSFWANGPVIQPAVLPAQGVLDTTPQPTPSPI